MNVMGIFIYSVVVSITLLLTAIGFALVYGVSRLPNFAHGGLYILTGYLVWGLLNKLGTNYIVATLLSLVIVAAIGAIIYQFVLRRVRGMPESEIIASFSLALGIMEGLRFLGLVGFAYTIPVFVRGTVVVAGIPVDWQRLIIIGVGLGVVAFLWVFTHYTKPGLALRAMAQDERAAMMLGIDSDLMAVVCLALGSSLAAVAAITILPLGNITIETGYNVLIYAVAVCVIGGLGSWPGAVVAAFVIGFAQILTTAYLTPQWHMVVVLLAILLTFIVRPSGLLGRQKQLEERV